MSSNSSYAIPSIYAIADLEISSPPLRFGSE